MEVRVGGKSYEKIKDTARRYDENKEKPVVIHKTSDIQKKKLENLMKNIEKPVNIPSKKKEWKPSDPKEFVHNVMGSSAGAGSGEFHVYRAIRKRTIQREEYISNQKSKEKEIVDFEQRVAENKAKEDAKTAKKRNKRQKRKAKLKKLKLEGKLAKDNPDKPESDQSCDDSSNEEYANK